jgi:GR25 family glycosyltransferase involved in LPS biosynthesis
LLFGVFQYLFMMLNMATIEDRSVVVSECEQTRHWARKGVQLALCLVFAMLCVMSASSRVDNASTERRLLRSLYAMDGSESVLEMPGDAVTASASAPGHLLASSSIPVFFINLDNSKDRRDFVEAELTKRDMKHKRVRAVTNAEALGVRMEVQTMIPPNNHEIACISSHLVAMWEALNDDTIDPTNPYAIIMEDDVALQFDVDFAELVNNAPPDFAILQLTTSNSFEVDRMWNDYSLAAASSANELIDSSIWRRHKLSDGLWSTQAYIIRKDAVKSFIEKAVTFDEEGKRTIKLLKTKETHCPKISNMPPNFPCLQQFRMAADLYLYDAFGPVYTFRVPIFNGAAVGRVSTIITQNKNKDASAAAAFAQIDGIINKVRSSMHLLPSYISLDVSNDGADTTAAKNSANTAADTAATAAAVVPISPVTTQLRSGVSRSIIPTSSGPSQPVAMIKPAPRASNWPASGPIAPTVLASVAALQSVAVQKGIQPNADAVSNRFRFRSSNPAPNVNVVKINSKRVTVNSMRKPNVVEHLEPTRRGFTRSTVASENESK